MTQVDFYLMEKGDRAGRDRIVCRLTDKAFALGRQVYLYTDSEAEAQQLDQLLWTFSAGSFVPHELNSGKTTVETPVCVGHREPPAEFADVLISLSDSVPPFFSRFDRVAEVVGAGDSDKQQARERYRFYRDRGYELQTHHL